ncbi:MAG: hypothetical protein KKA07_01035 [Bacteroidetes bacterium]|nr:hypothetical protein [Bacteroidota bacterium]MBU1717632.1 hypothetical protein [Bacteroidota bacterium]
MKRILITALLCFLLALQSCIDIIEEITVNKDGSGKVNVYLDMGSFAPMLSQVDKFIEVSFYNEIKSAPVVAAKNLGKIEGLTKIQPVVNESKGVFGISFEFPTPKHLNKAYYMLLERKKRFWQPGLMKAREEKFVRRNLAPIIRFIIKKHYSDIKDISVLKYISYKTAYKFGRTVSSFKNKQAEASWSNQGVQQECTLYDLFNEKELNIGNKVKISGK